MKIKIDIEIDTKEDMNEIESVVEVITEFRDKLIEMQDEYDD